MALPIRDNVRLAPLTTLGVGGPARHFIEVGSADEIRAAAEWARDAGVPLFVLGGGSNLLVSDRGFPGLVMRVAIHGVAEDTPGHFVAGAGEDWDGFVERAVNSGYGGVECLSGIPGTVGGTPVQNVGAYGQEVSETIVSVEALDRKDLSLRTIANADCGFGYRSSIFNTVERGRWVILRVSFRLHKDAAPKVTYRDLREFFAARSNASPTLLQVREAVREVRRSKAMLIVPGDDDARSAGSFFKNPVLSQADYQRFQRLTATRGEKVPFYPADGQSCKVPAAWLVEHSGFSKGYIRGAAGISHKHALAIVNRGGATASDIVALKNEIQQRVRDTFGIELVPEPVMVGFDEV